MWRCYVTIRCGWIPAWDELAPSSHLFIIHQLKLFDEYQSGGGWVKRGKGGGRGRREGVGRLRMGQGPSGDGDSASI